MDSGLIIFDNIQCELVCLPNFLSETHYVQKITSSPSTLAPNTIDISILNAFWISSNNLLLGNNSPGLAHQMLT